MTSASVVRSVSVAVLFLLPLPFLVDLGGLIRSSTGRECQSQRSVQILSDEQRDFLLHQYKTATVEINDRIDDEHILFVFKFTATGAILAFLLQKYRISIQAKNQKDKKLSIRGQAAFSIFLWSVVAISQIIDARLHFNTNIMLSLGCWVRGVENFMYQGNFTGWENFIPNAPITRNFFIFVIDRVLITYLLYLVATFLTLVLVSTKSFEFRIASFCLPFSIILFSIDGIYFSYMKDFGVYYFLYTILAFLFSIVCISGLKYTGRRQAANHGD